jgi:glycerophosphoryl diester phosphodiesterase
MAGLGERMGKVLPLVRRRPPGAARGWGRRDTPLVIGHRGASALALENTLTAFELAASHGADGVELDVWRCVSGEVVVFHDHDLRRLTDGLRRERVAQLSLPALREVRLRGGEAIPTLDEVLETLGPALLVNVELKTDGAPDGQELAAAVARVIRRHDAAARVIVSSFNPFALARFRVTAPTVPTGLLFHADQAGPLRRAWARALLRPLAVHPDRALCSAESVARWHREGYAVNVWTVDGEPEVRRLAALGVDGIITNDPRRTRGILARAAPAR